MKRKSLLARARGKWVTFVDDDEVVADDAVVVLLQALEENPDDVALGGGASLEDHAGRPSHRVFALRRSIALVVARRDASGREDFKSSGPMSAFLKRDVHIDRNIVHHHRESQEQHGRAAPSASRDAFQSAAA